MPLSGHQIEALQHAILDAFNRQDLEELVRKELDRRLETIAGVGSLETIVFELIEWADRNGRTDDLVLAVQRARPDRDDLRIIPHSDEFLDILVVCSSPVDRRPPLNLAEEVANFEQSVRATSIPIRLRRVFPPTFAQLEKQLSPPALRSGRPRVLHFLGHGDEDGLWFEREDGWGDRIPTTRLRKLLAGSPIDLVLLNTRSSATATVELLGLTLTRDGAVRTVIGHGQPVSDNAAIALALRFYDGIAGGKTAAEALSWALEAPADTGLPGAVEINLQGDGALVLGDGLTSEVGSGRVVDGMPASCYLPGVGFFCGRSAEYLDLAHSLEDPGQVAYAIWGMGGIGKTTLALEGARRNAWRYPKGGVVWVDARDLGPTPTTAGLLKTALALLDPGANPAAPDVELAQLFKAARGMIVLDNLEIVPPSEHDALARFITKVPRNGSRVILMSRTPIASFAGLPGVRPRKMVSGLEDIDGAHLAYRLAQTMDVAALQVPPQDDQGRPAGPCAEVSRSVSGHPLMISVAVGIAGNGLDALRDALRNLDGDLEVRLSAITATGLALVGKEGHRLLTLLPLFPAGRFTREEMNAVCAAIGAKRGEHAAGEAPDADGRTSWVTAGIYGLDRGGFLGFDQKTSVFTFHETLIEYVRSLHTGLPDDERDAGSAGLLRFYREFLDAHRDDDQAVDRYFGNVMLRLEAAWNQRMKTGNNSLDPTLVSIIDALHPYFERRGAWRSGSLWEERAREMRLGADDAALSQAALNRGKILRKQGKIPEADAALTEALGLAEKVGKTDIIIATLLELSAVAAAQLRIEAMEMLRNRALDLIRKKTNHG